jgi:uncharacterized protein YndB with AHSA1/START domain
MQMPHAEYTVTIDRPAREVFDYLADGTHNRQWRAGVLEIRHANSTTGEGAAYRQVLAGPGGRRIDGDYRVTVFNPPRRLEFLVTAGPARPAGVFELTDGTDRATVVRFALDVQPTGFMKLMTPMIARQMRREVAQLETLKKVLERADVQ